MCQYLHDNNNNKALYIDCKYLENIMSSVLLSFFCLFVFFFTLLSSLDVSCFNIKKKPEPKTCFVSDEGVSASVDPDVDASVRKRMSSALAKLFHVQLVL